MRTISPVVRGMLPAGLRRLFCLCCLLLTAAIPGTTARLSWVAPSATAAQPDASFVLLGTPNDPLFATDQPYLRAVHAPEAWDLQTGDPRIVVAVLDDGVDVGHPDLAPNIWSNPAAGAGDCGEDLHGCNFVDPSRSALCSLGSPVHLPDVAPLRWHGTFVAGVIAARGNNGQGIAGVAWNTSLMPVRVADCHGSADTVALVSGIHYAVDHGARIIDIGVGASRSQGGGCRPPSQVVSDAVQYARDHGALVVAGAGNGNHGCVDDPAAAPGALAVGGIALPGGGRWVHGRSGSNWGPEVTVAAPADAIIGPVPRRAGMTPPNDLYGSGSGTSFAAPIVAGEAALLLASNSLLTPDWLIELISLGAHPQPDGAAPNWAGAGLVDVAASLQLVPAAFTGTVREAGSPAPDGALVSAYVNGTLCAQASAYAAGEVSGYVLFVPAAAMQPGCGVPGILVELRIDGTPVTQVPWVPSAQQLDLDAEP